LATTVQQRWTVALLKEDLTPLMVGEFLYPFGDGAEVVKQHILILTGKAEISLLCSTALQTGHCHY